MSTTAERTETAHNTGKSRTKQQREIKVGDIIMFLGTPHRIDRIDPPSEATLSFFPTCCGFARSENGWGISLDGAGGVPMEVL